MLTRRITDRRAWTRDTLDAPPEWYFELPESVREMLDRVIEERRRRPGPITELNGPDSVAAFKPVRDELETGRGFVIVNGLPEGRYCPDDLQATYWLVGRLIGAPCAQNVQGTLLYDVKDTGQDVRYGARFSVTNAESTFHTDNSFGDDVLDYVGLLCLNTAKSGGLSQVISAFAVHNRLLERDPRILERLYEAFHVD